MGVGAVQANPVFNGERVACDEPGGFENAQMMRDGRPREVELAGKDRRPVGMHGKSCHDLASRLMGKHLNPGGWPLTHGRHDVKRLATTYTGLTTRDVPGVSPAAKA